MPTSPLPDLNAMPLPELFAALTADGAMARLVEAALAEDLGDVGDMTTQSVVDPGRPGRAAIVSRQGGVVAGLAAVQFIAGAVAGAFDVSFIAEASDGQSCRPGETLGVLEGRLPHILMLERPVLNLLGRLSGIATLTRQYVDAVEGLNVSIVDTRKTTPGLRALEKYAVRCGGGMLHRVGLFDALLFKDNHLAHVPPAELAATLTAAIELARRRFTLRFVEVEVDSLDQLREVLGLAEGLVDIVLLDNMSVEDLREAVRMRDAAQRRVRLEASGGVTLSTVRSVAETRVDRIAVGALTHGATSLDIGLDIAAGEGMRT